MILAELPPKIELAGTSFVTTAPAATIEFFTIVILGRIAAFPQSKLDFLLGWKVQIKNLLLVDQDWLDDRL